MQNIAEDKIIPDRYYYITISIYFPKILLHIMRSKQVTTIARYIVSSHLT